MSASPRKDQVPVSLISPLIRGWLKKHKALNEEKGFGNRYATKETEGHLDILGFQTGVSSTVLRKVMLGTYCSSKSQTEPNETIGFDLADKIVTAIDHTLWYREPLSEFYGPFDVTWAELRMGYELPEGYEFESKQRRYMWSNARMRNEEVAA